MKFFRFCVVAASLAASSMTSAAPITGQISINGYAQAVGAVGMGAATGLSFANGSGTTVTGSSGTIANDGGGSGSFAGASCSSGACGTIEDIADFATSAPISPFLTLLVNGASVIFDISAFTTISHNRSTDAVGFTATGTIHDPGFDDTPGSITFSSQGDDITSYLATLSATRAAAVAIPEPESLALIGIGLIGVAAVRRRRQEPASRNIGPRHGP